MSAYNGAIRLAYGKITKYLPMNNEALKLNEIQTLLVFFFLRSFVRSRPF